MSSPREAPAGVVAHPRRTCGPARREDLGDLGSLAEQLVLEGDPEGIVGEDEPELRGQVTFIIGVDLSCCRHKRGSRRVAVRTRCCERLDQAPGPVTPQHQRLLGTEVAVHRGRRHTGRLGDLFDGDVVEPRLPHHFDGHALDLGHRRTAISLSQSRPGHPVSVVAVTRQMKVTTTEWTAGQPDSRTAGQPDSRGFVSRRGRPAPRVRSPRPGHRSRRSRHRQPPAPLPSSGSAARPWRRHARFPRPERARCCTRLRVWIHGPVTSCEWNTSFAIRNHATGWTNPFSR